MPASDDTKLCPFCQEEIRVVAKKCKHCGEFLDDNFRQEHAPQPSGMERMLLPVGRSGWSIASGYMALVGFLPLVGAPFAIGAVITGLLALSDLKKRPKLSGAGRAWFGVVVGGMCILMNLGFLVAWIANQQRRGF